MRACWVFILGAILGSLATSFAHAQCADPLPPSRPGELRKPVLSPILGCERPFVYRGETYSVDSPQSQDASVLRSFVREVPEAEAHLKRYQERRELSRVSAYTGTVGIAMILIANTFMSHLDSSRYPIKTVLQLGGLGLTAGGFLYSFSLLRANEALIPKAVDSWNAARPADPIELKFQAGWSF